MEIGLLAIGVGQTADPDIIVRIARTAEAVGFHSVWAAEHVVLFDRFASKYPYRKDGSFPVPTNADFLDPFVALTFAAAHTSRLRLGTGVALLPERNAVVTAKEVASLDRVSGGRFDFGIGIGWLEEEFAAVGVPWERRAARTREYVRAMRSLWTEEEPEFHGEFVSFPKLRMFPKPVQKPHPPVLVGGNSAAALRRAGEIGDGWYGVGIDVDQARSAIREIARHAEAAGRDSGRFRYAVNPDRDGAIELDEVRRYRDAGVHELIVRGVAADPGAIERGLHELGERLVVPAAKI